MAYRQSRTPTSGHPSLNARAVDLHLTRTLLVRKWAMRHQSTKCECRVAPTPDFTWLVSEGWPAVNQVRVNDCSSRTGGGFPNVCNLWVGIVHCARKLRARFVNWRPDEERSFPAKSLFNHADNRRVVDVQQLQRDEPGGQSECGHLSPSNVVLKLRGHRSRAAVLPTTVTVTSSASRAC
jgi:hypothetical protein